MPIDDYYSYEIFDDNVDLNDYTFIDPPKETTTITIPDTIPLASELTHSTRTVTLSLLHPIDYNFFRTKIKNLGISIDYIPCDLLNWIIKNRIVKDNVPILDFFQTLENKIKRNHKLNLILCSKILKGKTESNFIDILEIYNNLQLNQKGFNTMVIRDLPIKTITGFKTRKRGFRNQITLRMNITENINIMVFQNGRLTITGCKSNLEIKNVASSIVHEIELLNNQGIEITKQPEWATEFMHLEIHDINCQSMNYHFNLNFSIDNYELFIGLVELHRESNNKLFYFLDFNPERFAGLKFRLNECPERGFKGSVCIVFQTGAINIYRSSSEEEVTFVYQLVNSWIQRLFHKIYINK